MIYELKSGIITLMLNVTFKEKQISVGDTVRVRYNIIEGGKTRVQAFEGIVIALHGRGENQALTVRRIGDRGIGVERIWPINAKTLVDIEVVGKPKKVRRSKLYFLRDLTGKSATRI